MTAFNPKQNQLSAQEWQSVAAKAIENDNSQYIIIGGIIGGLFAASVTGFPPTGLLVAAWSMHVAWKKTQDINRNEVAINQYGCIAHILKGDKLRQFRNQVGDEEVIKQIVWARENGYPITHDALDVVGTARQFSPSVRTPEARNQGTETREQETGNNRQPTTDNKQLPITKTNIVTFDKEPVDLVKKMAEDLKNSLVIGVPGVGKDFFVSNALDWVKKIHPNCTVFFIDPKDDPKETGYFNGRVDYLFRLNICECSPPFVYNWVQKCLKSYDEFDAGNGIKLLVFNELAATNGTLTNVKGALNWLVSKMVGYSSSGDSRGIKIWGVSSNGHNSGTGFDGGSRSIFTPYVIISDTQLPASENILRAQIIPGDRKISSDKMMELCQQSPVGRAIFHGGLNQWFPMPELHNFSGYNRDKRSPVDPPKTNKSQSQLLIEKLESTDKSLDSFIREDLGLSGEKVEKMKQAIALTVKDRKDLLEKFNLVSKGYG
jgi:hypothetical protein